MFKTLYQVRRADDSVIAESKSLLEMETTIKAETALLRPARLVSVRTIITNQPWRTIVERAQRTLGDGTE